MILLKVYGGLLLIPSNGRERSIESGLFVFPDCENYRFQEKVIMLNTNI